MIVLGLLTLSVVFGVGLFGSMILRKVVPTNEVHILQSANKTTSYGKDTGNGNTYFEWPSAIPFVGVRKSVLTTSVFDLDLLNYEAYDKDRLPFVVTVKAFFRITDTNLAAQRVVNFEELHNQLKSIVQGAVRKILASSEIDEIMTGRSKFGREFTEEVDGQLANWGVATVKSIELMDIQDHKDSRVIQNIMEKKKSHIEMESRTEVAKNQKLAQIAEISAKQEVDMQSQASKQAVNLRQIEVDRTTELQFQAKLQTVKEQEKTTKEREMAVVQVTQVKNAQIEQEVSLIKAEQQKNIALVNAEAQKGTALLVAEGNLESKKREAQGIELEGLAKAASERAMLMAPVEAQTTLAKEIGQNESYQKYLITIRQVEAQQAVGIEQAKALTEADIKVIANSGSPGAGITNVMDLFSSKGGTELGAMLEGFVASDTGKALLNKVLPNGNKLQ
jgi:flotillin